jgi:hypothetical protein
MNILKVIVASNVGDLSKFDIGAKRGSDKAKKRLFKAGISFDPFKRTNSKTRVYVYLPLRFDIFGRI